MKQIGIRILCVLLCMVLLTACGQTPQLPDESVLQNVSISSTTTESTTTTTTEEATTTTTTTTTSTTTTTTTTTSTTTTTTTTTVETTTTTTTTKGAVGTEDTPPASLSFNWKGEEVLLTFERVKEAWGTLGEAAMTGWTFVSKEEKEVEINWRYSGTTKDGKKISCDVLPLSREILRVSQWVEVDAGPDDEEAIRNEVYEDLHNMGYTYTKEEIFVYISSIEKGSRDGYFANAQAHNETDGGLYMTVYWEKGRGWQLQNIFLEVNNRYRIPNWQ